MKMKPFPGVPEDLKEETVKILFEAAALVNSKNTIRGKQVEKILLTVGKCALNPPAYFDLYMSLAPLMPEQFEWWNENQPQVKEFLSSGLEHMDPKILSISEDVPEELQELSPEGFYMFLSLLTIIRRIKNGPDNCEAVEILDSILWCVYIGMMRSDYFSKNYKVIMEVGKRASEGRSNIMANGISPN
jgi:hypothetical protein